MGSLTQHGVLAKSLAGAGPPELRPCCGLRPPKCIWGVGRRGPREVIEVRQGREGGAPRMGLVPSGEEEETPEPFLSAV